MAFGKKSDYFQDYGIMVLVVFFILIGLVYGLSKYLPNHPELLNIGKDAINSYGMIGVALSAFLGGTVLPLPSTLVVAGFAALSLHNIIPFLGVAVLATSAAGYLNFWLARVFRKRFVLRYLDGKTLKRFENMWVRYGEMLLWINGVLPISLFDPLTLVAGLSKMDTEHFLTILVATRIVMYSFVIMLGLVVKQVWFPFV
ncbi:hypothetical protein COT72_01445 [archaeon CG10_big_fil_rev_8_21_14_0_10_43_11]|nr:MAG: hypothetical protein COT72_01445 [archaeon CG10_big_fil_rev_8_21_14_0_10_43_11]